MGVLTRQLECGKGFAETIARSEPAKQKRRLSENMSHRLAEEGGQKDWTARKIKLKPEFVDDVHQKDMNQSYGDAFHENLFLCS